MRTLHVYPTSRAVRAAKERLREQEGFVPDMMRIDEFESRALWVPGRAAVDGLQRRLLLREAADFDAFSQFGVPRRMTRFFSHTDAFFRFFEELAGEQVELEALGEADVYAEYADHLAVLGELRDRYDALLREKGLFDKSFFWRDSRLSNAFLRRYERIEIHLEGYLTRAETALLLRIAEHVPLFVHYRMTRFSQKMRERFAKEGMATQDNGTVTFDMTQRRIVGCEPLEARGDIEVLGVEERSEQIAAIFAAVASYVERGVPPERIAVVLPDESLVPLLRRFDRYRNLNFAMGFGYDTFEGFKRLEGFYEALTSPGRDTSVPYGETTDTAQEDIRRWKSDEAVEIETFWRLLEPLEAAESTELAQKLTEQKETMRALFASARFSLREWLFLWLERLREIRIDDTGGGRVTVLGVLETRAVAFDAVIIPDFNEGIVPASSSKDRFLNSAVRTFAGLPTRSDRESLQKYYYDNLLRRSSYATILYAQSDARLASKFLYELGLHETRRVHVPREVFYPIAARRASLDPSVAFNAGEHLWSASRLATMVRCKRQYYYRYIRGLRATQEEEFNEGAYIHRVLDALYTRESGAEDPAHTQERLRSILEETHPQGRVRGRYEAMLYTQKLAPLLNAQAARFEEGWRIAACEEEISGEIGGLRFTGRIDRIDTHEETTRAALIDYKTGRIPAPSGKATPEDVSDFQMPVYEALYPGEAELLYCDVFKGTWVEPARMELQREALAMRLEELRGMEELVAQKTDDLKACTFCDYRLVCERGEYLNR